MADDVTAMMLVALRDGNLTPGPAKVVAIRVVAMGWPLESGLTENSTTVEPIAMELMMMRLVSMAKYMPTSTLKFVSAQSKHE
jgi:hypothetical protein